MSSDLQRDSGDQRSLGHLIKQTGQREKERVVGEREREREREHVNTTLTHGQW